MTQPSHQQPSSYSANFILLIISGIWNTCTQVLETLFAVHLDLNLLASTLLAVFFPILVSGVFAGNILGRGFSILNASLSNSNSRSQQQEATIYFLNHFLWLAFLFILLMVPLFIYYSYSHLPHITILKAYSRTSNWYLIYSLIVTIERVLVNVLLWILINLGRSWNASFALLIVTGITPLLMWLLSLSPWVINSEQAVLGLVQAQVIASLVLIILFSIPIYRFIQPSMPITSWFRRFDLQYVVKVLKRGLANAGEVTIYPLNWYFIELITTHINPAYYPVLTVIQRIDTFLIHTTNSVIHASIPELAKSYAQQLNKDFNSYLFKLIGYTFFVMAIGSITISISLTAIGHTLSPEASVSKSLIDSWPWVPLFSNQLQIFVMINTIVSVIGIYSVPWIGNLSRLLVLIILLWLEQTTGFLTLNLFWVIVVGWQGLVIAWETYRCWKTINQSCDT